MDTTKSMNIVWRTKVGSGVTASVDVLEDDNLLVCCTTEGYVKLLDPDTGDVVFMSDKFQGEIFSSPVTIGEKIVLGCRDNILYCFNVSG